MKLYKRFKPLFKGMALLLAVVMLCLQVAEALHHHTGTDTKPEKHYSGAQQKMHGHDQCALCHYLSHAHTAALGQLFSYLLVGSLLLIVAVSNLITGPLYGYCTLSGNKGPPALLR